MQFLANIRKIRDRGYPGLAFRLLELGEDEAAVLAASSADLARRAAKAGPGKAVSLGLDAEYQNTYTANLSYTNFFDGKYTTVDDRDFVALSFGVNF